MPTRSVRSLPAEVIKAYHYKNCPTPVIGVTGGKGGVGKTTVAVNIAGALAALGHKVALVDADVDAPNAALLLGLALTNPREVSATMPLVDEDTCTSCGACVQACRLNALFLPKGKAPLLLGACNGCEACLLVCEPRALQRGQRSVGKTYKARVGKLTLYTGELLPSQEESALVVDRLKDRVFQEGADFDIMVVDTSPGAHCNVIKALQGSDLVITVTEPTPLAAHDFELILQLLDLFALKRSAFLNRADLPCPHQEVEKIADDHNTPFVAQLASDILLKQSYVAGIPLVTMFPEAASARTFGRLAHDIAREYLS